MNSNKTTFFEVTTTK